MIETAEVTVHDPARTDSVRDFRAGKADPEVMDKPKRRRHSASYKLKVLEEVDRHPEQSGAILRREGLYSSHLSIWRKQRREGGLEALAKKRGPKGKSAEQKEIEKLQREKARLAKELYKARVLLDAQKKLAEILGVDLPKVAEPYNESDEHE